MRPLIREIAYNCSISPNDMRTSLRKMSLSSIVMVLTIVAMTISPTVFASTSPVAFGELKAVDSEQTVTVTTNDSDQNNATTDRHVSSLRITQSPENGLDVECGGDLKCEILDNNTVVANTTSGQNTTTSITSALNALNQSLTQSLNQSSIIPFGNNNNDFGMLNEQDLDSEIEGLIDRILNETLGDLQSPLQTPPDLLSASV
jgi:hypothetical protein